ncbi:hypothetical protein K3725_11130 [Leisingera sp. S132]|uniref:hypothetical protein n=1 Tax=Leisingera sp. S132 TaxID=2867016 RepID=UPI0021A64F0E|nr:hypothetical protein [Leisingera sp. S132]UWQ77874.1 hypothetical protein K3725_11130 [Leisingera sp. S132]
MKRDDTSYLEALAEVTDQSKASIGIASVPLGIILVQLRYLANVEGTWIKVLATGGVVTLFIATVLAWLMAMTIQSTYAMELYRRDGKESVKGRDYANWILSLAKDPAAYTELYALNVSRKLVVPFWVLCSTGYLSLFALVVAIIWQSPTEATLPAPVAQ